MVNGSFSLPQPLAARGTADAQWSTVGTHALELRSLTQPVGAETITMQFRQDIAATDALRTGGYTKTLTFTLSSARP
jgi:hypothetical protein